MDYRGFDSKYGGVNGSFVEYQGRIEKEAFELKYKIIKAVRNVLTEAVVDKRILEL